MKLRSVRVLSISVKTKVLVLKGPTGVLILVIAPSVGLESFATKVSITAWFSDKVLGNFKLEWT